MSWGLVVTAAVTAGSAAKSSRDQKKAAGKAGDEAEDAFRQADSILTGAANRRLELPDFNAVDETGPFVPDLFRVFDETGRTDASGNPLPDLLSEIGRAFSQDVTNARRALPAVAEFSRERQAEATKIYDDFLEQSGLAAGNRSATDALTSFLNFELPDSARREINRRSSEVAFRSGTAGSSPSLDFANRLDFDTRTRNFFAALPQFRSQVLQRAGFTQPGLDNSFIPAAGTSLAGAQGNFQLRSQSALLNYSNQLDQNIQRFQNQLTERVSNFERQDAFDQLRANILTGQGNASQQRANALSAASDQSLNRAFSALGQVAGPLAGSALKLGGQALQGAGLLFGADPRQFQAANAPNGTPR